DTALPEKPAPRSQGPPVMPRSGGRRVASSLQFLSGGESLVNAAAPDFKSRFQVICGQIFQGCVGYRGGFRGRQAAQRLASALGIGGGIACAATRLGRKRGSLRKLRPEHASGFPQRYEGSLVHFTSIYTGKTNATP